MIIFALLGGCSPKSTIILPPLLGTTPQQKTCAIVLTPGTPTVSSTESATQSLGPGDPTLRYTDLFRQLLGRYLSAESNFTEVSTIEDPLEYSIKTLPFSDESTVELEVPQVSAESLSVKSHYLLIIQKYAVDQTYMTTASSPAPFDAPAPAIPAPPRLEQPIVTSMQLSHSLWFLYYDVLQALPVAYGRISFIDKGNGAHKSDWMSAIQTIAENVVKETPFKRKK